MRIKCWTRLLAIVALVAISMNATASSTAPFIVLNWKWTHHGTFAGHYCPFSGCCCIFTFSPGSASLTHIAEGFADVGAEIVPTSGGAIFHIQFMSQPTFAPDAPYLDIEDAWSLPPDVAQLLGYANVRLLPGTYRYVEEASQYGDLYVAANVTAFAPGSSLCSGDGSLATECPCGNVGLAGRGCQNSASTGGALLSADGSAAQDTVVLTASGVLSSSVSLFFQGDNSIAAGAVFGDGVRCVSGALKRLYVKTAVAGTVSAPGRSEASILARSLALGDSVTRGASRYYQVCYRDASRPFCSNLNSESWNVSSGIAIVW